VSDEFLAMEGSCKCERARFRMKSAPIITHCCHCRDCQKVSHSAFAINTMIESDHLEIIHGSHVSIQTGARTEIRCSECNDALWVHRADLGKGIAFVGTGLLDESESLVPEAHYFVRSKHAWISIPPDVPSFETLGDPDKSGMKERIMAVLASVGGPA